MGQSGRHTLFCGHRASSSPFWLGALLALRGAPGTLRSPGLSFPEATACCCEESTFVTQGLGEHSPGGGGSGVGEEGTLCRLWPWG